MNKTQMQSAPPKVAASGPIVGVVVHGRGAVVTRRIEIDTELPAESFDLSIGSITPLADPGSVRVVLPADGRELVGVNARIDVPDRDPGHGATTERVEQLNRKIDRLHERENSLKERAQRLQAALVTPEPGKALREEGPAARVATALALSEVISETVASIDARIIDLRLELESTTRERDAAQLEDLQQSGADRSGDGSPTRAFDLRIAAGDAPLRTLELSYAVPYAAKWWPQYTLRLTEAGTHATLAIEALVAQRTGEDWTNVPIGLSTAAIIFDATLPKLPSLRLGKRQPAESRGFREPPAGADRLFESYDGFRGRQEAPRKPMPARQTVHEDVTAVMSLEEGTDDVTGNVDRDKAEFKRVMAKARGRAEPDLEYESIMMPPQSMARKSSVLGAAAGAVAAPFAMAAQAIGGLSDGFGGGGAHRYDDDVAPSHDPGDNWLEFDSLVMAARDEAGRGRLKRRPAASGLPESELFDAQESARRMNLTDPAVSRGLFDYRYDSEGSVRIPADGRLHRIDILQAPAASRLHWRTVPLADPAVYREAMLENPFESPLLAGPVDVFSEGQLVTTTAIDRVEAGGSMRVGLGVDERIRVARNVRMREESAGLLGGKRELIHDVEIELRSGLGATATIEVIDRVPVTSDDDVHIELLAEEPTGQSYDQSEHDHPIEGGRLWSISLPAGGREKLAIRYQVTLRSKDELVGGNRRA